MGGDTRMKSGMAIKVTPPTIISVFQARGFLGSLPSIHSSRNYHIHVTDKELAQLDLKSFFPDSRSPAFFSLYPMTSWEEPELSHFAAGNTEAWHRGI